MGSWLADRTGQAVLRRPQRDDVGRWAAAACAGVAAAFIIGFFLTLGLATSKLESYPVVIITWLGLPVDFLESIGRAPIDSRVSRNLREADEGSSRK